MTDETVKNSNNKKKSTTNRERIRRVRGLPSEKNNTPVRITITYVHKKLEKTTTHINNDPKRKQKCFSLRRHVVRTNAAQIQSHNFTSRKRWIDMKRLRTGDITERGQPEVKDENQNITFPDIWWRLSQTSTERFATCT